MFPHHFDGFYPSLARNQWAAFEKYVGFKIRQGSINTADEFKNMSALTLPGIAWNCFEPFMNGIQDMAILEAPLEIPFLWTEQCMGWHNIKIQLQYTLCRAVWLGPMSIRENDGHIKWQDSRIFQRIISSKDRITVS